MMIEKTFGELKEGQKFHLECEGILTEWEKISLTDVPGTGCKYKMNAIADGASLHVSVDEQVWIK